MAPFSIQWAPCARHGGEYVATEQTVCKLVVLVVRSDRRPRTPSASRVAPMHCQDTCTRNWLLLRTRTPSEQRAQVRCPVLQYLFDSV